MQSFEFNELFLKYRYPLLALLIGLVLVGGGIFIYKSGIFAGTKVEVIDQNNAGPDSHQDITVEIAGEVINPGVYKLPGGSRVDDLLLRAGGFSESADRVWAGKYLNRAAKLIDGQKVYVPKSNEQSNAATAKNSGLVQSTSSIFSSDSNGLIDINSASLSQLDSLPGIGPVYGQSIIDHRPYSNVEELLSKAVLRKSVYEKIKDVVSVY